MSGPRFELYDHAVGLFTLFPEKDTVTMESILRNSWPEPPDGRQIIYTAPMYDIPITMIRALRNFGKSYNGALAVIYQTPNAIEEIIEADTGIGLIIEASLPPLGIPNRKAWQHKTIEQSVGAGCVGALIDFNPRELEDYGPGFLLLRRLTGAGHSESAS